MANSIICRSSSHKQISKQRQQTFVFAPTRKMQGEPRQLPLRLRNKVNKIANTLKTNRIDTCLFAQTHKMLANKNSYRSDSKTTSLTLGLLALLALARLTRFACFACLA